MVEKDVFPHVVRRMLLNEKLNFCGSLAG